MGCLALVTTLTVIHSQAMLLAMHAQGRIGHYVLKAPMVIGHECAG